ncbi:MAG: 3-hydroxyacyl-CoA dehydrogenase NAD-binding domain-containing protein [Saprospiraceae bacterium]
MIRLTKDTDHIVTLELDMGGSADNLLNHKIVDAFQPVIKHLQDEKQRGALRGIIVRSAKRSFMSGGELEYLQSNEGPAELFVLTQRLKMLLRNLEHPGVPVVAALNGSALGIGFEFALACHYRVAIDSPKVNFGLPEINLGLMPGAGACMRLMWSLGIERAYPLLTSGHRYTPSEAHAEGLVDQLVANEEAMLDAAKKYILSTPHGSRRWDRGGEIPGGTARDATVSRYIVSQAAAIAKAHKTHYPAYAAILNTLAEGSKVDFDTGLRIETRKYTELLSDPTAHNMINAFWFERRELNSGANRPKGFGKFRVRTVGIVGAGQMGSGMGYACSRAGLVVIIKDVSRAIALKGKELAEAEAENEVARGTLSRKEADQLLERLSFTERFDDFEHCDLVIEAVFESEKVKSKVIREIGQHMDEYALLASNTISIPISRLAKSSYQPSQFVGLHFFPPAQSVPLVEIVRGDQTSDETIARAFDFVRAIKKVPILVKDDWGFYVARVQNTYILEGITMLLEGYPPALIENLGLQLGMPAGPLILADRISLDIVMSYEQQAADHYGKKYVQHPAVEVLSFMLSEGRTGRAKGRGFYDYSTDVPELWSGLTDKYVTKKIDFDRTYLEERLLFSQVLEAGWCLHEGVISLVSEANLGSIYGWGFPANFGGVINYAKQYPASDFLERTKALMAQSGPRFQTSGALKKIIAPKKKAKRKA